MLVWCRWHQWRRCRREGGAGGRTSIVNGRNAARLADAKARFPEAEILQRYRPARDVDAMMQEIVAWWARSIIW